MKQWAQERYNPMLSALAGVGLSNEDQRKLDKEAGMV